MDKYCDNCKFWSKEEEEDDRLPIAIEDTHRACKKAIFSEGDNPDEIKSAPMVTCDGSGYLGILYTAKNHYCKSWESQE